MFATKIEQFPRAESNSVRGIAMQIRARHQKSAADDPTISRAEMISVRDNVIPCAESHAEKVAESAFELGRFTASRNAIPRATKHLPRATTNSVRGLHIFRARLQNSGRGKWAENLARYGNGHNF